MAMESYYPIGQAPLSSRLISQLSILERSLMDETTSELEPNRRQNYVGLHFPSGPATVYAQPKPVEYKTYHYSLPSVRPKTVSLSSI
jgi:hypothetical protein